MSKLNINTMPNKFAVKAMRESKRWIIWKYANGKKKPILKEWNRPERWMTYSEASAALLPDQRLGFVLGDGWAGIDVDGAWDAGRKHLPHSRQVWESCKGAYVERSPSGNGYKAFMQVDPAVSDSARRRLPGAHVGIEVYATRGRWFAVTGDKLQGAGGDVHDSAAVSAFYALIRELKGDAARRVLDQPPELATALSAVRKHTPSSEQQLRDSLSLLSADDRKTWIDYGHAIKAMAWDDDVAFDVWHDWSATSANYAGEEDCRKHWQGFNPSGDLSVASIFFAARQVAGQASPTTHAQKARLNLLTARQVMAKTNKTTYQTALGMALPVGFVLMHGLGGSGKTTIAATWAADVTTGKACPPWETEDTERKPGGVLWLTSEENVSGIVLPRHDALGGDLDRLMVPAIRTTSRGPDGVALATDLDLENDLPNLLQQASVELRTPVRLVVCDSVAALVRWDGRSPNADADVKQVLARLKDLAESWDCCILGIAHENKKTDAAVEHRVMGSQAWRESGRLAWRVHRGHIYANKCNDAPEMGCAFEQREIKVLHEYKAETETGDTIRVAARRADFARPLLHRAQVEQLIKSEKDEMRAHMPTRVDRMSEAAEAYLRDVHALLGGPIVPSDLWDAVSSAYGSKPNSKEIKQIRERLGLVQEGNGPAVCYVRSNRQPPAVGSP